MKTPPPNPARGLTTTLAWLGLFLGGCVTPADVPDRSASPVPEQTLDRGFSANSPTTAPTATGQIGGGFGDSALPTSNVPPGFGGVR